MLLGNYLAKLDLQKGRTSLPSKFRSILGKKIIVTLGFENTLMIIGLNSWEKVVGGIVNQPFVAGAARDTDRFLLGSAFEAELDSQGRFIIPQTLRTQTKLTEDIFFVGVGNRVEVWSKEAWERHQEYLATNIETITQKLNVKPEQ